MQEKKELLIDCLVHFIGVYKLSRCCQIMDDVQRAMELAEEAVAVVSHSFPNDHPDTALCELVIKRVILW